MTPEKVAVHIDLKHLQSWVGKKDADSDTVAPRVVAQMAGLLGWDEAPHIGDLLPAPWHWLLFNPVPRADSTGVDGHPARGGFLPPVPLPRRMWAGSRVEYPGQLKVGDQVSRISRIKSVAAKTGRAGELVFVTVEHLLMNAAGRLVIREEQDLVYTEAVSAQKPQEQGAIRAVDDVTPMWSESIVADPVMLFRYSALTFNGHRIHYDRQYATEQEGYPGLVVHAPLTASLLLDALGRHGKGALLSEFSFRGRRPLFDGSRIELQGLQPEGKKQQLRAISASGQPALTIDVLLSPQG